MQKQTFKVYYFPKDMEREIDCLRYFELPVKHVKAKSPKAAMRILRKKYPDRVPLAAVAKSEKRPVRELRYALDDLRETRLPAYVAMENKPSIACEQDAHTIDEAMDLIVAWMTEFLKSRTKKSEHWKIPNFERELRTLMSEASRDATKTNDHKHIHVLFQSGKSQEIRALANKVGIKSYRSSMYVSIWLVKWLGANVFTPYLGHGFAKCDRDDDGVRSLRPKKEVNP
jgi:hypothetical protein